MGDGFTVLGKSKFVFVHPVEPFSPALSRRTEERQVANKNKVV